MCIKLNGQQRETCSTYYTLRGKPPPSLVLNHLLTILLQFHPFCRPLHLACISGYVDVVAALIRMAPHPCLFNIQNDEAQTPLHLATLTAQPKIIRMLLIAGAEVSK